MAVHDTEENGRSKYTEETFRSLLYTVDFTKHSLMIGDNASCDKTRELYGGMHYAMVAKFGQDVGWNVFHNKKNLGTAEAINQCITCRSEHQFVIKMDNDCIIRSAGWVEEMEEAITRMPSIGILGLKRKDLWEHPSHENLDFRSKLIMLPHETGQRWIVVEQAPHIIGTCQMFNPALLDKIGYLKQPGVYGYDDSLASLRSQIAGFKNCFLPHIEIEHIDVGGDAYCDWKTKEAERGGKEFGNLRAKYQSGEIPVYYNPFETK